jgi:hypothetical protein
MLKLVNLSLALAVIVGACTTAPPKTDAQKCAAMGGTYNAATRSCQFQGPGGEELKKR